MFSQKQPSGEFKLRDDKKEENKPESKVASNLSNTPPKNLSELLEKIGQITTRIMRIADRDLPYIFETDKEKIEEYKKSVSSSVAQGLEEIHILLDAIAKTEDDQYECIARYLSMVNEKKIEAESQQEFYVFTKAKLFDALMDGWFEANINHLLVSRDKTPEHCLPKDGHDIRDDFIAFACTLACEMAEADLQEVNPTNKEIWGKFFNNQDTNYKRALNACPLQKVEGKKDTYAFVSSCLLNYFRVLQIRKEEINQSDDNSYRPKM